MPVPGSTHEGNLNSIYYALYYSITNALALTGEGATAPKFELVIVGTFPDARYFSITDDDMHYSNAQHLADFTNRSGRRLGRFVFQPL